MHVYACAYLCLRRRKNLVYFNKNRIFFYAFNNIFDATIRTDAFASEVFLCGYKNILKLNSDDFMLLK